MFSKLQKVEEKIKHVFITFKNMTQLCFSSVYFAHGLVVSFLSVLYQMNATHNLQYVSKKLICSYKFTLVVI